MSKGLTNISIIQRQKKPLEKCNHEENLPTKQAR